MNARVKGLLVNTRRLGCITALGVLVGSVSGRAQAGELSVAAERRVQVGALATGYAFATLHTVILLGSLPSGRPLDRNWVGSGLLSSVTLVGTATGYAVLAAQASDPDRRATFALAAAPGFVLGGALLTTSIDGVLRGRGGRTIDDGPAMVSLLHGLSLSVLSSVLVFAANSQSSDLSKIGPIYSWAAGGTLLAGYSIASLLE